MKTLVLAISLLACSSAWSLGKDNFTLSQPGEVMRDVMSRRDNLKEFVQQARELSAQQKAQQQAADHSQRSPNSSETTTK